MITVVDYGMGNLRNVARAFREIGEEVTVSDDPGVIGAATSLVLPGVGAFGEAVRRIDGLGLRGPITAHARRGRPLLGICLGMQLFFDASDESPGAQGLGFLAGRVVAFAADVKVPHIGWNDVQPLARTAGRSALFPAASAAGCFYFVHSYCVASSTSAVAATSYGGDFVAAVEKGNIAGVQFHPEKSQESGLALLRRFVRQ